MEKKEEPTNQNAGLCLGRPHLCRSSLLQQSKAGLRLVHEALQGLVLSFRRTLTLAYK